ncbi:uncharacterized protein LOC144106489 isoform X1 [Amblyomma americanum]
MLPLFFILRVNFNSGVLRSCRREQGPHQTSLRLRPAPRGARAFLLGLRSGVCFRLPPHLGGVATAPPLHRGDRRSHALRSQFGPRQCAAGWMSGAPSPPGLKPARLLALLLLLCARASLAEEGDDLREPVHHTASTTCPEKIPLWQCLRLSWSAPPCRTNFDCAMPFPCCVTWCRNFCANDFRA